MLRVDITVFIIRTRIVIGYTFETLNFSPYKTKKRTLVKYTNMKKKWNKNYTGTCYQNQHNTTYIKYVCNRKYTCYKKTKICKILWADVTLILCTKMTSSHCFVFLLLSLIKRSLFTMQTTTRQDCVWKEATQHPFEKQFKGDGLRRGLLLVFRGHYAYVPT